MTTDPDALSEYTPTDEDVREDFAYPWEGFPQVREERLAAYDRWLAAHDTRVKREAWSEGAHTMTTGTDNEWIDQQNPYKETPDA